MHSLLLICTDYFRLYGMTCHLVQSIWSQPILPVYFSWMCWQQYASSVWLQSPLVSTSSCWHSTMAAGPMAKWESKRRRIILFNTLISFDQPCVLVNALYSSAAIWFVSPAVLLLKIFLSVWEYYTSVAITALYNYIRVCNLYMLLLQQVLKASEEF